MRGPDSLALSLWGEEIFKQIPKGIFGAAAFYFADASKGEGQTAQERFFEVWTGMLQLGAMNPSSFCRRELKKYLKAQGRSSEEIKAFMTPLKPLVEEKEAEIAPIEEAQK